MLDFNIHLKINKCRTKHQKVRQDFLQIDRIEIEFLIFRAQIEEHNHIIDLIFYNNIEDILCLDI